MRELSLARGFYPMLPWTWVATTTTRRVEAKAKEKEKGKVARTTTPTKGKGKTYVPDVAKDMTLHRRLQHRHVRR